MASSINLEERFNIAVKYIQNLPPDGVLQPSNLTKLIFYGLYKQAMLGPCKESRPTMFNYIARAKWEAWDRYKTMTKEQAMLAYIDEIRKIVETMPQTNEVLEFAKSMGLSNDSIDDQTKENNSVLLTENLQQQQQTTDNQNEQPSINTNEPIQTFASVNNGSAPSSSPSVSSLSSSSISSSDIDEFYDDPSDLLSLDMTSNNNFQQQPINTTRLHHHEPSNEGQYSTSSVTFGNNDRYSTNNYNKETQRAILTALTKLQRDINNILERLNRLEASTNFLQQRGISLSSELNSSQKWYPLSGFRRRTIAFILFWPFIAYVLIRLILRARIIIRFRR